MTFKRNLEVSGVFCMKCKWSDFHKTTVCPRCNGPVTETTFSGHGRIATYTVIRYPPRGFENEAPYVVGLIDLDDGPRVIARIQGESESVNVGAPVLLMRNSNGILEFALE